jgi:hypothetical protein
LCIMLNTMLVGLSGSIASSPLGLLILGGLLGWASYEGWRRWSRTGGIPGALLQAVKGDRARALRLLAHARERNPGKSERWCVEKVLYELERDGAGCGRGRGLGFQWPGWLRF